MQLVSRNGAPRRLKRQKFMSEKKPSPLIIWPKPKICPVCGHASYSASGLHPQCAMSLADRLQSKRWATEAKANTGNPPADAGVKDGK